MNLNTHNILVLPVSPSGKHVLMERRGPGPINAISNSSIDSPSMQNPADYWTFAMNAMKEAVGIETLRYRLVADIDYPLYSHEQKGHNIRTTVFTCTLDPDRPLPTDRGCSLVWVSSFDVLHARPENNLFVDATLLAFCLNRTLSEHPITENCVPDVIKTYVLTFKGSHSYAELPAETVHILQKAGITLSMADIMSDTQLGTLPRIGPASIEAVRKTIRKLKDYGCFDMPAVRIKGEDPCPTLN